MSEPTRPSSELRRDVDAALGARHDLGPDYEDAVAASLADRVEEIVAQRTAQVVATPEERQHARDEEKATGDGRFFIALASLGAGIPITGIVHDSIISTAIAWAGIVGINVAAALRGRRPRRPDVG
ncbi:hypothetical protein [Microlunatus antarcticus]|uniref:Uncharacterized protein n=1 Tax=Microlunatus antarcticus TaxID=53388 RepID=A0A7W5P968_9ACTN|nr:hypothetical protein [Microlunatus antarcticus]MBB3328596.1 hypothetical protein [Microlunatus antarcticus]